MAKMTRSERKARRQAQAASAAGQSSSASVAQVRPQASVKTQTGSRKKEDKGIRSFVFESWGELKKVEWPTQSHVVQGTVVVLIACVIVGTYIWVADIVFKNLVQDIFLR